MTWNWNPWWLGDHPILGNLQFFRIPPRKKGGKPPQNRPLPSTMGRHQKVKTAESAWDKAACAAWFDWRFDMFDAWLIDTLQKFCLEITQNGQSSNGPARSHWGYLMSLGWRVIEPQESCVCVCPASLMLCRSSKFHNFRSQTVKRYQKHWKILLAALLHVRSGNSKILCIWCKDVQGTGLVSCEPGTAWIMSLCHCE